MAKIREFNHNNYFFGKDPQKTGEKYVGAKLQKGRNVHMLIPEVFWPKGSPAVFYFLTGKIGY